MRRWLTVLVLASSVLCVFAESDLDAYMRGKVFRMWVNDDADKSDSEEDPLGPPSGTRKTIRGGNIQLPVLKCFPSVSFPGPVDQGGPGVGFRVAIVPEDLANP